MSSAPIRLRRAYQLAPQFGASVEEEADSEAAAEMAKACEAIWQFRLTEQAQPACRGRPEHGWAAAI